MQTESTQGMGAHKFGEEEARRVKDVQQGLVAQRLDTLSQEVARLRRQLAIERAISREPRRCGRAEALEIIMRMDPAVAVALLTTRLPGTPANEGGIEARGWNRHALESVLGVTPDNPIQDAAALMDQVIDEATTNLSEARVRIAALQRSMEVMLENSMDGDLGTSLQLQPAHLGQLEKGRRIG